MVKYFQLRVYISIRLLRHRLAEAVSTWPTRKDWLLAGQTLFIFSSIVLPMGFMSRLVIWDLTSLPWPTRMLILGRVLIFPAMVEESFWRVLLLPHKTERMSDRKRWLLGLPILAMFVLMHPLNSMTFYTAAFPIFTDPFFLISTTLLGLMAMDSCPL